MKKVEELKPILIAYHILDQESEMLVEKQKEFEENGEAFEEEEYTGRLENNPELDTLINEAEKEASGGRSDRKKYTV